MWMRETAWEWGRWRRRRRWSWTVTYNEGGASVSLSFPPLSFPSLSLSLCICSVPLLFFFLFICPPLFPLVSSPCHVPYLEVHVMYIYIALLKCTFSAGPFFSRYSFSVRASPIFSFTFGSQIICVFPPEKQEPILFPAACYCQSPADVSLDRYTAPSQICQYGCMMCGKMIKIEIQK